MDRNEIMIKCLLIGFLITATVSIITLSYAPELKSISPLIGALIGVYLVFNEYKSAIIFGAITGGVSNAIVTMIVLLTTNISWNSLIETTVTDLVLGAILGIIGGVLAILIKEKLLKKNIAKDENIKEIDIK